MQVLLPYPDFKNSAIVLSDEHLKKQIEDIIGLLDAFYQSKIIWTSHSVIKMWMGHETQLINYGLLLVQEAQSRGILCDNYLSKLVEQAQHYDEDTGLPWWFGDPLVHQSHRAYLRALDWKHYGKFTWAEMPSKDIYIPTVAKTDSITVVDGWNNLNLRRLARLDMDADEASEAD